MLQIGKSLTAWGILVAFSVLGAALGAATVWVHAAGSRSAASGQVSQTEDLVDFSRAMVHERIFVAFVLGAALIACAIVGHSGVGSLSTAPSMHLRTESARAQHSRKDSSSGSIKLHWLRKPIYVGNGLHLWRAVCGVWLGAGTFCMVVSGLGLIASSVSNAAPDLQPVLQLLLGASPTSILMLSISPVLLAIGKPVSGHAAAPAVAATPGSPARAGGNCGYSRPGARLVSALVLFVLWRLLAYFAGAESIKHRDFDSSSAFSTTPDLCLRLAAFALSGAEIFWVATAVRALPSAFDTASPTAIALVLHNRALLIAALLVDSAALLCFPSSTVSALAAVQSVHSISFGLVLPVLFLAAARVEANRLDLAKATAAITRFGKEFHQSIGGAAKTAAALKKQLLPRLTVDSFWLNDSVSASMMSRSSSGGSPRDVVYDVDEPSPPPASAYAQHTVLAARRDRPSSSGPGGSTDGGRSGKSPHDLHRLMSSWSSDTDAQPTAARTATSARSELNTPSSGNRRSLFARGASEAFATSQVERKPSTSRPAWLRSGFSSDEEEAVAANSSLTAKSANSSVLARARGLQSNSLPKPGADEHSISPFAGADLEQAATAAAPAGVVRLNLPTGESPRGGAGDSSAHGAGHALGRADNSASLSSSHSMEYTPDLGEAQDSQRTELAVVQPSSQPNTCVNSGRSSTGPGSSILSASLPSGFMVTMDGARVSLSGAPSAQATTAAQSHPARRAGGVGDAADPHGMSSGGAAAAATEATADKSAAAPVPSRAAAAQGGMADPNDPTPHPQPATSMKHGYKGGVMSHGGRRGGGGDSVVRFADEDSQPSSKGTTALLKDPHDGERNPSYMTNCRMQMLIMEEPPRGARSADYVCYLRKSMDAMRAELHAVMEQTHKAQAWMKRRERLVQLQQGLLRPATTEVFMFSAPWARLRARFEGMSRSVTWGSFHQHRYLRAKSADMALLEEAANELFKVIWRRAAATSDTDITVEMVLQPARESSVGTAVVPAVHGVIPGSRVSIPSSISGSCFGCLALAAEDGTAGRDASYGVQHSDEDMVDDSLGSAGVGQPRLEVDAWFRFALVVRFVDKGPSITSRIPATRIGSGQESDDADEQLQQQLEESCTEDFPLNDEEYVSVQIAREVARLHGGHVSFAYSPSQSGVGSTPGGRRTGSTQAVFSIFARACNSLETMLNDTFSMGSSPDAEAAIGSGVVASGAGAAAPALIADNPLASAAEEGRSGTQHGTSPGTAVGASAAAQAASRVPAGQQGGLTEENLKALELEQIAEAMHPSVLLLEGPMQPPHESVLPDEDVDADAVSRPRRVQVNLHAASATADDPTGGAAAAAEAGAAADSLLYGGSPPEKGMHTPAAAAGYQLPIGQRQLSVCADAGPVGALRPPEELLEVSTIDLASKARALDSVTAEGVVLCRKFHPTECRQHVLVVTPHKSTAESLVGILANLPSVCTYAVASTTQQLEQMVLAPCSKGIPLPTAVFITSQLGQAHADVLAYFLKRNGLLSVSIAVAMPGEEQALLQLFPQVMRSPCLAPDVKASLLQSRYE